MSLALHRPKPLAQQAGKAQESWVKNSAHYANNSIRMAHMIAARFWSQKGSAAPISGIT
jgi:hypothetical protein